MAPKKKTVSASAEPIEVDQQEEVEEVVDATGEEEEKAEEEGEEEEDEDEDEEGDENEFEVEAIMDHRQNGGKFQYLVGWKGYGPEHNTWEPEENVEHASSVVSAYWSTRPKPDITKPSRSGRGGSKSGSAAPKGGAANKKAKTAPAAQDKASAGRGRTSTNGKRKAAALSDDEEDVEPDFAVTHVDSVDKYQDVADWENLVASIDTIERHPSGDLQVYMTMIGSEQICQPTSVAYKRCPQKILSFYEAHLKWKHQGAQ